MELMFYQNYLKMVSKDNVDFKDASFKLFISLLDWLVSFKEYIKNGIKFLHENWRGVVLLIVIISLIQLYFQERIILFNILDTLKILK